MFLRSHKVIRTQILNFKSISRIFSQSFKTSRSITDFKKSYANIEKEQELVNFPEHLAGRVLSLRKMGKSLIFADLSSNGDKVQVLFNQAKLMDYELASLKSVKRGYILGLSGIPYKTKAGELSLLVKNFEIMSQCLVELPIINRDDKDMLKDPETRYNKRYLDLIVNNNHKNYFVLRCEIIKYLRQFLTEKGFMEVETPILSHKAGGALAKPFETRSNAIKSNLYLRIAPELYLKQLIIGGFEKVFEIGKNFRNEDISIKHNPEFTSCEFYESYSDHLRLIDLTKHLFSGLCLHLFNSSRITLNNGTDQETVIDFNTDYQVFDVREELQSYFNLTFSNDKDTFYSQIEVAYKNYSRLSGKGEKEISIKKKIDKLIENIIEPKCVKPSFIINHPIIMSPLAKASSTHPLFADRFEFFINRIELINAYSELNDATEQRKRFTEQNTMKGIDEETHPMDNDFIEALSYGMPPTAGWGLGIDRLCMVLLGLQNIKEVILFPLMNVK